MATSGLFLYCTTSKDGTYTMCPKCPSTYKIETIQITTDSTRTVGKGAYLNKELLATKKKFNFTWYYMEADEYAIIENLFYNQNFFWIKIVDPRLPTSGFQIFHVYGGDMSAEAIHSDGDTDGKITAWKNISWNLIER